MLSHKSNGLRDKQIADLMSISKSAVQLHLRAACDKLSANNTTHGVAIAIARKFIKEPKQPDIVDLEHQIHLLGLSEIASAFLLDRYNMISSAGLPAEALSDYNKFLNELIGGSM